jgi:hypothetical protein
VLATHATYYGTEEAFEALYLRFGRDLRRLIAFVRDVVAHQSDPERYLSGWLSNRSNATAQAPGGGRAAVAPPDTRRDL